MKKILKGFRYDTEKAILIGEHEHSYHGDFSWWKAGLYMTAKAKRFFIAGRGNAASRFASSSEFGGSDPGSKLIPVTKIEALVFAEMYIDPEEFEKYFEIKDA